MEYDKDLNTCINIAHRVTSSMGWRSDEPLEPAGEEIGARPTLDAGSPHPSGIAHQSITLREVEPCSDLE